MAGARRTADFDTASAQQPAAIAGQIVDVTGAPVEGATIALTGNSLLAPRTATTNADGRYRLDLLAAGTYTITVEKAGVGRLTGTIVASNSRDTTGDFILGANIIEKIAVTSSSPDVNLASTEITFSYKREFIDSLPLERSYKGLLQLTPGVAENGTFAPNGGGSRQDNTYLIDGASITNPLFGYLSTEVNELDVAEVHIKRGAVSAESGRSQGFITNVVTKSGTNRLMGDVPVRSDTGSVDSGVGPAGAGVDRPLDQRRGRRRADRQKQAVSLRLGAAVLVHDCRRSQLLRSAA